MVTQAQTWETRLFPVVETQHGKIYTESHVNPVVGKALQHFDGIRHPEYLAKGSSFLSH